MEGIYFFGEYQRWNLGWDNPNQAGAFIAMLIPWLWGIAAMLSGSAMRLRVTGGLVFLWEMGLWFLLCKTYSRGALVAVVLVSLLHFGLIRLFGLRGIGARGLLFRLLTVAGVLVGTGFFARVNPQFVSQDASAGNRLVLWKGGLQMISVSPWRGWGVGNSGSGFMHWFQPLDSNEVYAGMVNSYLHVAVERGLPVLCGVLTVGLFLTGVILVSSILSGSRQGGRFLLHGRLSQLQLSSGSSIMVFMIANFFSTLWIFESLWWFPGGAVLFGVAVGIWSCERSHFRIAFVCMGLSILVSIILAFCLWFVGGRIVGATRISLSKNGDTVYCGGGNGPEHQILLLPDRSVLGETWGKEIRRLTAQESGLRVNVPVDDGLVTLGNGDAISIIIACGARADEGVVALSNHPEARLILVHPLRAGVNLELPGRDVSVLLPMLDTHRSGRKWRAICKDQGWKYKTSPGVGQDIRLAWPEVLDL